MVSATASRALDRREAVRALLADRGEALVVTGLGSPSYDVNAAGDRPDNFYLWGAMGGAALVGLGLAQARPDRQVIVVTGDGEQMMGLGGLATIGVASPKVVNLDVVVIDNGRFGETGMQPSHTGQGVDLAAIALACGFAQATTVRTEAELAAFAGGLRTKAEGPRLCVVKVEAEEMARSMPPKDAVFLKHRFRGHLGLEPG